MPIRSLVGAVIIGLASSACSSESTDKPAAQPPATVGTTPRDADKKDAGNAKKQVALPRGGRRIFPRYRVVAHYGAAGSDELGILGEGSPKHAARVLKKRARSYRRFAKPVMPAMELIATVAQAAPGSSGDYSVGSTDKEVKRYLRAVRKIRGLLILDIQPGQNGFLQEVKRYRKFLKEPDVSLALDPEWSMHGGAQPADEVGWTTARVVNRVSAYLAKIVARYDLPQKLLVIHQFRRDMVRNRQQIKARDGLAITFHIDGFGGRAAKLSKYDALSRKESFNGFKLFLDEDVNMLSPKEVMRKLRPTPDLVTYQ